MSDIEELIQGMRRQISDQAKKFEANSIDSFDKYISKSVNSIFEKVQELEQISSNMQKSYVQRLTKILETRKQAEASFLDERKKLTSLVKDLEILYQRRNESFQGSLKKELALLKSAYDKMKDENGRNVLKKACWLNN